MIRSQIFCAALLLAAALAGCGGGKVTKASDQQAEAVLARLRQSYATTPDLMLKGNLTTSEAPIAIIFEALIRSRDSLRIDLVGPFAVPLGSLSSTPDQFTFFSVEEGVAIDGAPNRETFGKMLMIDMDYNEMVSMLRGEIPRFPAPGSYRAEWRGDDVTFIAKTAGGEDRFTVDTTDMTVLNYARYGATSAPDGIGAAGPEEFGVTYDLYYPLGGRRFPKKAVVNINNGARKVIVNVETPKSGIDADRSCALVIPAGIEHRHL
ncbi:MAG: DUF4292 domain-containing protein [Candidatus Kapaibacterium sp.]